MFLHEIYFEEKDDKVKIFLYFFPVIDFIYNDTSLGFHISPPGWIIFSFAKKKRYLSVVSIFKKKKKLNNLGHRPNWIE